MNRHAYIDDLNFYSDRRVICGRANAPTVTIGIDDETVDTTEWTQDEIDEGIRVIELPWKWDVCPICRGRGTHVNPSIDASGLTADDFADDPDFADDYLAGAYDQTCNHCDGRTTVQVVEVRATPADLLELYRRECEDAARDARERAHEIAMGY